MKTNRTLQLAVVLVLGVMLASACTYSYSQAPLGTPTTIPTGLFVSPFPSGQDPLKIIADLGTQTAQAQTAAAGGATVAVAGTPGTPSTQAAATDTVAAGATMDQTQAAETLLPVTVLPGGSTFTPGPTSSTVVVPTISGTVSVPTTSGTVGPVPSTYTLQKGEWPFCIARRFNLNPTELLTLNNLSDAQSTMLMPGLVLSIPQTGDPFPADRAWHSHPDTYTVVSGDTLNGIACYYGDLTPAAIATANNLSSSATLTAGQKLTIP